MPRYSSIPRELANFRCSDRRQGRRDSQVTVPKLPITEQEKRHYPPRPGMGDSSLFALCCWTLLQNPRFGLGWSPTPPFTCLQCCFRTLPHLPPYYLVLPTTLQLTCPRQTWVATLNRAENRAGQWDRTPCYRLHYYHLQNPIGIYLTDILFAFR